MRLLIIMLPLKRDNSKKRERRQKLSSKERLIQVYKLTQSCLGLLYRWFNILNKIYKRQNTCILFKEMLFFFKYAHAFNQMSNSIVIIFIRVQ